MRKIYYLLIVLLSPYFLQAQDVPMDYYFPGVEFNPDIPAPKDFLGFQIGDWHVSHDKLYYYLSTIASLSDRAVMIEYARSHENRPLVYLAISSEENIKKADQIRKDHIALCEPGVAKGDTENMPAVVYQGYSIHGNESSGSNTALLMAYYLLAGQGEVVENILNNTVVLLDPCFNPDGLDRFASWANRHKSNNLVSDPASREFHEVWPGGRTNHYWFDLNRDWLLVQHPESQGRIKTFHQWKPNILTDHHEMGSNNTYFFQPGIPSRVNPMTPKKNQELTYSIAEFHAKALDKIGSLYYSGESFDDFYYGKGSTYPDVNACIGILFEQASSRGHLQETVNGKLSFPFTIRNQLATSISTVQSAVALRKELLDYQHEFYNNAFSESKQDKIAGYIFNTGDDASRLFHFTELLDKHEINIHALTKDIKVGNIEFKKDEAYVVPMQQAQYRLIKASFENYTKFEDSLFYDVSAWTLPHSFDMNLERLNKGQIGVIGDKIEMLDIFRNVVSKTYIVGDSSDYAYAFRWNDYYAPKVLNYLQKNGLRTKVATENFSTEINGQKEDFKPGSIIIPIQNQEKSSKEINSIIVDAIQYTACQVFALKTGLTDEGIDLGSPSFKPLKQPKVLLVVGDGVRSYDAGEVWHLLDVRYGMEMSMIETDDIGNADLKKYTCIVMVDGGYGKINGAGIGKIKSWLNDGGTLVTMRNAIKWAKSNGLANVNFVDKAKPVNPEKVEERRAYGHLQRDSGANFIGGAIGESKLDLTHPICYGYTDDYLPVFRRGTLFLKPANNKYAMPVVYTEKALLSGYISDENLKQMKNSASIIVSGHGSGRTINMADNPNFRAFWHGTNKLFANAIFFGNIISYSATEKASPKKK